MSDQFNFSDYPYTNFNEVNLDYILETLKQIADQSQGEPGVGVPTGGTTGQVLTKASDTDYDTEWSDVDTSDVEYFDVTLTLAAGGAYYNSDKTPAQIVAAIAAGQTVRGILSADDETEYTFHLSYRPATFDGEFYTDDHVSFLLMDGRTISCEGSRTVWPFDAVVGQYDSRLSLASTNAVQNRVITEALQNIQPSQEDIQDAVDAWLDDHAESIDGLSFDSKNALLELLRNVAYTVPNGEQLYTTLENALTQGIVVTEISAVFNPPHDVYNLYSLDYIKQWITVTAVYSNGNTEIVDQSLYTLTGVMTVGSQVMSISYMDKTTTITVNVVGSQRVITGYNANNNNTLIKEDWPFILGGGSSSYSFDTTKKVIAFETGFTATGVITVGIFDKSHGISANTNANRAYFTEIETFNITTTGLQKLFLSAPFLLPSGYALAICKGLSDTADWKFGNSGTNKGFTYIKDATLKYMYSANSLGFNVYTEV